MSTYHIYLINNSDHSGAAAFFQQRPDFNGSPVLWDLRPSAAHSNTQFDLDIDDDFANIPNDTDSVGVSMSGAGTFAALAQAGGEDEYPVQPQYYVAFGDFAPGQVLDPSQLTGAVPVVFPAEGDTLTVTLNPDDSLTVAPGDR